MIRCLEPTGAGVAERVVEIQRAAYAEEARLIGFGDIPPLRESAVDVRNLTDLDWRGAHVDGVLAAIIGWRSVGPDEIEIDRLAVHPAYARRGLGRRLVEAVPRVRRTVVSTGAENGPARALYEGLGFTFERVSEVEPGARIVTYRRQSG